MATLNPEAQGSIYIPEPVSTPSALGAIGNIVGFAADAMKAKNTVQNSSAYKAAADQARLVGLQDGLYKAQELKKQGKKAQGESVERQVILNFARDGGDLGDASVKQTILLSTGKSMEQAGRTPEEIANQQFMESADYGPLVLAGMYELGPDKTSQDYHNYAVSQRAKQEYMRTAIQDTSLSWLEGKQQIFTDTISMFQKTTLGGLQVAAATQGFVKREDFLVAQQQWNGLKKELTANRPVGLPDEQWKPIKEQMELMDETITLLSGIAGTAGIEATMLNDIATGLYETAKEAGDKVSLLSASALIQAVKERPVEAIQNWGIQDPTQLRAILLAENKVKITGDDDKPIPDGVKEQYKGIDATTKFNDAAALTKAQGGSTPLRPETYNHITVDHLTKAFGAMQSVANDNGQFVSVDGINKVFNGGVVNSIKEVGKSAPDAARKLADAGFEALDSQYAVAVGALTSIVEGSGLGFDRGTGQLVISPDSLSSLGVPSDRVTLLNSLANQYYGGDMVAMVKDRGRAFRGSTSPEARQGAALVTSGTLGNMTTVIERAQQQEKVVRRLDTLRNDFRTLGDSFVDTNIQGGAGTDQTAGAAGNDQLRRTREETLNAPAFTVPQNVQEDTQFVQAIVNTSNRLRIKPEWLTRVMHFETGGTFAPGQKNAAGSGATGLIQFMPDTAKGLGTTVEKLANMTRTEQMYFVEQHISQHLANVENPTFSDVYMSVLYPAAVGKPESFVLFKKGTKAYEQNAGLDIDGSGTVTKAEAAAKAWGGSGSEMVFPEVSGEVFTSPRPPENVPNRNAIVDVATDTPDAPTVQEVASTPQSEAPQRYTQATPQEVEQLSQQTKSMLERLQVNPESLKSFRNGEDMLRAYKEGQIQDGEFILLGGEVFEV